MAVMLSYGAPSTTAFAVQAPPPPSLWLGTASAMPGDSESATVIIPIELFSDGVDIADLQFDLDLPSYVTCSFAGNEGTGGAAIGKKLLAGSDDAGIRVVIYGYDRASLPSGTIANLELSISDDAPGGEVLLEASNIVAADPNAEAVAVQAFAGYITIVSPEPEIELEITAGPDASDVSKTSATIAWTTNEAASSLVKYWRDGETVANASEASASGLTLAHSVGLSGLASGTTYHFQVFSKDADDNEVSSAALSFTTVDGTPPVIGAGPTVSNVSKPSATIAWVTNESATSLVKYWRDGETVANANEASAPGLTPGHIVTLSGLSSGTKYFYQVFSKDADDNEASSAVLSFTTVPASDTTPPTVSSVTATGISDSQATISWTTDEPATTQVDYWTAGNTTHIPATGGGLSTAHALTLTGLSAN
ncbi:MAG: fibronectin type III domain-containing protein, partial [Acidobacteriota bacterium]|nr:fibronectin type III domain-containing protein [Acidobacteriota bacterium]